MQSVEVLLLVGIASFMTLVVFLTGMHLGRKLFVWEVKKSPEEGKVRAGCYFQGLDMVMLNPEVFRRLSFRQFILTAIHEYMHAHRHRFLEEEKTHEVMEKEAYEWADQFMMLLSEKLDWTELEETVSLMRGYMVFEPENGDEEMLNTRKAKE